MVPPTTQPVSNRILHSRQLLDSAAAALVEPTGPYPGLSAIVLSVVGVEAAVNDFLELVASVPPEDVQTLDARVRVLHEIVIATEFAERTDRTPLNKRIRILGRALIQDDDVFHRRPFTDLKLAIDWRNHIAHSRPERLFWDVDTKRYRSELKLRNRSYEALGISPPPTDIVSSFHSLLATAKAGRFAFDAALEAVRSMTYWFPERYVVTTGYVSLRESLPEE